MALILTEYAPFDDGSGASVTEAVWRKFMRYPVATGVLANILGQFEVYADSTGRQVKVRAGECWIQGHWGAQAAETTIALDANTSGATRTDRIVLRADFVNNLIELDKITGGAPVTQNTSLWEISLATVQVANGAVTIAPGNVADTRQRVGQAGGNIEYYLAGTQNVPHSGAGGSPGFKVGFDTAVRTSADIEVSGAGNTDFKVKRAGTWSVNASVGYSSTVVADYYAFMILAGSPIIRLSSASVTSTATLTPVMTVSMTRHFNIGESFSIQALQFSGSPKALFTTDQSTRMSMTWISDA